MSFIIQFTKSTVALSLFLSLSLPSAGWSGPMNPDPQDPPTDHSNPNKTSPKPSQYPCPQEQEEFYFNTGRRVVTKRHPHKAKQVKMSREFGYTYMNGYSGIQPLFIRDLGTMRSANVLEIGAGMGNTLAKLFAAGSQQEGTIRYVVNEIGTKAQQYLRKAKHLKKTSRVTPLLSTQPALTHLKRNKTPYDCIYSSMVFHFFDPVQYVETLLECHRNLKKGGRLYLLQNNYLYSKDDPGMIDFQANKQKGVLFPGYYISERAAGIDWLETYQTDIPSTETEVVTQLLAASFIPAGEKNPYPLLNFHDRKSLTNLAQLCGFQVETCHDYIEIFSNISYGYVGMVATKGKRPSQRQIDRLMKRAQQLKDRVAALNVSPFFSTNEMMMFTQYRVPFTMKQLKSLSVEKHKGV